MERGAKAHQSAERVELVIFDCDGVLVDSERLAIRVESRLITSLGWDISEEEVVQRFVGRSDSYMLGEIESVLGRRVPDWQELYERHLHAAFRSELRAVDGIVTALDALSIPTCVASSGTHDKMRLTLGLTNLFDRFEGRIFSVTEVGRGKPAPDLFLHAAAEMGLAPRECVVVEDSSSGVEAARAAWNARLRLRRRRYSGIGATRTGNHRLRPHGRPSGTDRNLVVAHANFGHVCDGVSCAAMSTVHGDIDDQGVAVVTLSDPENRNALRYELVQDLTAAVQEVVGDGARALVLEAAPPVFCAGGSLDELLEPKADLEDLYSGFLALARCPIPTIAAVGGACIGAGVNLPLACDVIVTSPSARFDPRWLDVGIHPGGGHLRRLAERMGRQAAAALVLCGEAIDGEDAARTGLAWKCVPADDLHDTAVKLASVAARRDPELVRRTKASLDAELVAEDPDQTMRIELDAQRWSMQRPGFREGVLRLRDRLRR